MDHFKIKLIEKKNSIHFKNEPKNPLKIKPYEGNETFCMAPWAHTYLSPQSERRLCCVSREKASWNDQYIDAEKSDADSTYDPKTLKEHWNSPYMMDIRRRLMKGEKIPQCQVCNNKILVNDPYRNYFNDIFRHRIDEAFEKTREDGYTEMETRSFDYRITNVCNFKCRMCGDMLSSAWEIEDRKRGVYGFENDSIKRWTTAENKTKIAKFQRDVAEKELWDAVKNETIEEIYWVGGEPLMWPIHWEIMSHLNKCSFSKNVIIRYNTNLSKINYRDYYFYDFLSNFKSVKVSASIDGTGEIVEYIRDGIKWNSWLENFKKGLFLNDLYDQWGIYIDLTISSPGLFSIKDLIDLAVEYDVNSTVKYVFAFDPEIIISPLMIPRKILNPILDDILDYAKSKAQKNHKIQCYVDGIENIKNKQTFDETFDNYEEGIREGKRRMKELDKFRGHENVLENIFSRNKDLIDWWRSI